MPQDRGHLFVVHGRLESVHADAAIVPVGPTFHFERYWTSIVGSRPQRPERWPREGWGRAFGGPRRCWAVSTGTRDEPYGLVVERIVRCLESIDRRRGKHQPVRGGGTRPLATVPVIGIGRGGFSGDRGHVIRCLVEALTESAERLDLDVALVTPSASVHAAAQYARRHATTPLPPEAEEKARVLGVRAKDGGLALFLGAGVGVPAGLPTWHQLVESLALKHGVRALAAGDSELTVTDQAQLIERAAKKQFQQDIASLVEDHTTPSLLHGLLAGLACREVVTTNYDKLYETSVTATGAAVHSVMPWESGRGAERWVLKLHGDVTRPESIVLTRRHMVMYDALNRPSGSVLQTLLLTKHLLVVGASMTDDNVVRLAHEVQSYRSAHEREPSTFGTVLDAGGDQVRKQLWDDQVDWLLMPSLGHGSGPRGVELFLDRVGYHATRDSSWLLDERFEGLLDHERDRELARTVRGLHAELSLRPDPKWEPLVAQLERLGMRGNR